MIRTYAGALNHEFLTNEVKDAYILDAWKIFEKIKEENKVSIQILNSLLLVHCRALKPDQVEVSIHLNVPALIILGTCFTFIRAI